jgi:hypothetical protein
MLNTLTFIALIAIAEAAVVWLAYSLGHESGWLDGWDQRQGK